ncbi:hypothetical protein DPMN_193572 [Dreissena polymorpha]|uniref:Uncharacterized protein n=1 Tax=Dreissena polymorpha TaxID=45954 RepID=A0A9D4BCQ5_DREPO|nr:hypothetical protein DPMN_193572 [Dreissena polymorpha]
MISRKLAQFEALGGVRINFKSHLNFYPTSGPTRNRVEIETRSDDQRTSIARRSPDIGFIERVSAKEKVSSDRLIAGGPPHDARQTPDDARDDERSVIRDYKVHKKQPQYRVICRQRSHFDIL